MEFDEKISESDTFPESQELLRRHMTSRRSLVVLVFSSPETVKICVSDDDRTRSLPILFVCDVTDATVFADVTVDAVNSSSLRFTSCSNHVWNAFVAPPLVTTLLFTSRDSSFPKQHVIRSTNEQGEVQQCGGHEQQEVDDAQEGDVQQCESAR